MVEGEPAEHQSEEGAGDAPGDEADRPLPVPAVGEHDLAALVAKEHLEHRRQATWNRWEEEGGGGGEWREERERKC